MKTKYQIQFEKDHSAMKYYLIGMQYHTALKAMGFAAQYHTGFRKNGVTPEFHHQIRIAFTILGLKGLVNEQECLALAFLHDTPEDYKVPFSTLKEKFGESIAQKAFILDKSTHVDSATYFAACSECPSCSIVKGSDNIDNIQSMHGAFTPEKIESYIKRTKTDILPMLKLASNFTPSQAIAYQVLRNTLKNQIALYEALQQKDTIQ